MEDQWRIRFWKPHEILFLLAGITMLATLPVLSDVGLSVWLLPKTMYVAGIVFFVIDIMKVHD